MTPRWTGLVAAATVASVLSVLAASALTYALARARSAPGSLPGIERATAADGESAVDPEAGVVRCPECGTENDLGYRFCRSCVADLPGGPEVGRSGAPPFGRGIR